MRKTAEKRKKHTLVFWSNLLLLLLLSVILALFLIFFNVSMRNLIDQEIENRSAVLKLNVENIDGSLQALEKYLYQSFSGSQAVSDLEHSDSELERFMATQEISRDLDRILGWNESIKFLFFYSDVSGTVSFIRASIDGRDLNRNIELGDEIRKYIEEETGRGNVLGRGYLLLRLNGEGYVIRFYKISGSYVGMCLEAETVLEPLEELTRNKETLAFLCNNKGEVISRSEEMEMNVDIENSGRLMDYEGKSYLQLSHLSEKGDFYIGTLTEMEAIMRQLSWIRGLILVFAAVTVVFMAGVSILIGKYLYRTLHSIVENMKRVGGGEWDLLMEENSRVLEYDSMISHFNKMVVEIKDLKIQNYEKELAAQRIHLHYLQTQINPHFYLNALNIIYSLAQVKNYVLIQKMTMSLVEYSRYMFREPDTLVTVSQEMEHVDNYMNIQKMRFPDRIDYQAQISSKIDDAMIPPFIIQSFVENSIKYATGTGEICRILIRGTITEKEEKPYVILEIRDNGQGYSEELLAAASDLTQDAGGTRTGLQNVQQRLKLIFGNEAELRLGNNNGAVAEILMPLIFQGEEIDGEL